MKDKKRLRVLIVNNFYYNRGGDCTYMFALKGLLERHGHEVVVFSMHHPQNYSSIYSRYFVSHIDYREEIKNINPFSGLKVASRAIFSIEAKRKMEGLIRKEMPDIAHINNIYHHITPSIFYPLRKHRIPIIWTLHDYTIICPNTSFFAHNKICERCKKRRFFWPPLIRCKKGSFLASLLAGIETTVHRVMRVNDLVDVFISPSCFLRTKLIEYGFDADRIVTLYHFFEDDESIQSNKIGNYLLYVGRLSHEKGIKTLIDSMEGMKTRLKIIGDGPLRDDMIGHVQSKKMDNVEFLGHMTHDEVMRYIKGSNFLVIPSEWYETYCFAVIEAFACGRTVIASRIGGIPELVKDGKTGLTFNPGDVNDLRNKINYLINHPEEAERLGRNGQLFVKDELNAERYYQRLMEIYLSQIRDHPH